ncbi:MAG TPA: alpha/beta fold hydrolase [Acidimicrobiales bacterium]|nr:alpha/beta fold hydrolase [Acidimicrobiales bacterium]
MATAMPLSGGTPHHLQWERTIVQGRPALYGVAGEGLPVVFLHGWGLGQHSYKRALKRLVQLGVRVYAPALPGFGGTPDLPRAAFSFAGYAAWVDAFLAAVGVEEPVFMVGHSFGGGVAIKTAHDFPDRVRTLVLVNSLGGAMPGRPLWDWGIHFPLDVKNVRLFSRVVPVVVEDALPNVVRNPRAMWKVTHLARQADLTPELEELRQRELPVVVLWGRNDGVIPRASFDALCAAIGTEGEVVDGAHSWLLADPDAFGEVMTNVVSVAKLAWEADRRAEAAPTPPKRRRLLGLLPKPGS